MREFPERREWGNFDFKKWFSHVPISFCHMSVFYHINTSLGHERQIEERNILQSFHFLRSNFIKRQKFYLNDENSSCSF